MGLLRGSSSAILAFAGTLRPLTRVALRGAEAVFGADLWAEVGLFRVAIRVKLSVRRK